MRHRRISRSPGATVFHAGGAERGLTPAPDCRVPAANGSGRILWTRRSNEGWPSGCPLDDPSFATAVSTCSPVRKGTIASLIHRPRSRNGERGHAPHPISPGGAFRGRGQSRLLQPAAQATGSPTDSSDRSVLREKSRAALIVSRIWSKETVALTRHCPCGTATLEYPAVWPYRPDCPECPNPETP